MHCASPSLPLTNLSRADDVSHIETGKPPATYAALLDKLMRYRMLIDQSPDAILVCRRSTLVLINQAADRLLAAGNGSPLLGRSILDFVHPDFHAALHRDALKAVSRAAPAALREQVWMREDGTPVHVEIAMTALLYDGAPALQIVARDISERKRASELQAGQNRILHMVATDAPLAAILDAISRLISAASGDRLRALPMPLAGGINLPGEFVAPLAGRTSNQSQSLAVVHKTAKPETPCLPDEEEWSVCASRAIRDKKGRLLGELLAYSRRPAGAAPDAELLDMAVHLAAIAMESRAVEERMRRLAHYDGLTALPNRFLFREYLDLALHNARRHGGKFALFFLDLDDFKKINDSFGHAAGDLALKEVAARLRGALRHTDKVARMGGDEFYVLIENLSGAHDAADIAQKLVHDVSRPLRINGRQCTLGVSIGIAVYPDDGTDAARLLENADRAMYGAKEGGKNACRFFSSPPAHKASKESGVLPAS